MFGRYQLSTVIIIPIGVLILVKGVFLFFCYMLIATNLLVVVEYLISKIVFDSLSFLLLKKFFILVIFILDFGLNSDKNSFFEHRFYHSENGLSCKIIKKRKKISVPTKINIPNQLSG